MKQEYIKFRNDIIMGIHEFFQNREFIFTDTKRLVDFPGTEPNISLYLSDNKYLIPSPEIEIKKIISSLKIKKCYDIGHVFRKDEKTLQHSDEFTMLEWYRTNETLDDIKKDITFLLSNLINKLNLNITLPPPPWKSISLFSIFKEKLNIDITSHQSMAKGFIEITGRKEHFSIDEIFYLLYMDFIEKELPANEPFFLNDFPVYIPSLAKIKEDNINLTDRFEFYFAGLEIANAYNELTGTDNYKKRFQLMNKLLVEKGKNKIVIPADFLSEIELFPNTVGIALGIDRLIMALTGTSKITEIIY